MHGGEPEGCEPLPGAAAATVAQVDHARWSSLASSFANSGARLVALWATPGREPGSQTVLSAAYAERGGLACVRLAVAPGATYPDLGGRFPAAVRMQRALFDLSGVRAEGAGDERPWLRHDAWPVDYFPLRREVSGSERFTASGEDYPFVRVAGDGVHEIPVGPIHAGIIEPGHFRFSIVGEKVLRLEQRLGYVHKGIDKRFESLATTQAHRLAGRVSGDSTVAFAWAYCMALEGAARCTITPRAAALRALLLERERVANHLGDLGALGNDAALAFGLAQFSRLREDWLRLNAQLFGHRLLMDRVVPGGVAIELDAAGAARIAVQCERLQAEVAALRAIYDEHAGLQDRFMETGRVGTELAARLGLCGLAARASGLARDVRVDAPCVPYDRLGVRIATSRTGDVAARVAVRFEEIFESLRLIQRLLIDLPQGASAVDVPALPDTRLGIGWLEGWRGEVLVALEAGPGSVIRRCHCHDPSWQNWPVLEHAVIGNIVPDFPLINKSFNLSYSGQDL